MRTAVAALLIGGAAQASEPAPDPAQLKLDGAIQGLKEEVARFDRDANTVEAMVAYPGHSRTDIYLGVTVNALLLKSIKVTIDDREPTAYLISDPEARALLNSGGLQRVARLSLPPGPHRLKAEYTAQFADAKEGAAPIGGRYEAIFDKTNREADLEIAIARSSRLSEPEMRLREYKAAPAGETLPPDDKPPKRRIHWRLPWQ